jgi:flavin-dependent dehydrogenase
MTYDAVIVGASIAGCATALSLAQKQLKVLLLERSTIGRDKACGEGLLPVGVDALSRLGAAHLLSHIDAQPFYGVGFSFEDKLAQANFPNGHAFGVRRKKFDAALFQYAASLPGVTARDNCRVEGLLFGGGCIRGVALPRQEKIYAEVVIGADGLASTMRAATGLDGGVSTSRRYGMRVHFTMQNAKPFGDYVRVLLDHPGEFYFTPVGANELQVAYLGDPAKRGISKKNYVSHIKSHPRLREIFADAEASSEVMGAGPFRRKARGVVLDGFALVGDAAGYVDAVTGEGMELALRSAEALGECVSRALQSGGPTQKNLMPYAKARQEIVQDPDRLTQLVLLLEGYPWLARRAIDALNQRPHILQKLLSVQGGEAKLSSLSLSDWVGLIA